MQIVALVLTNCRSARYRDLIESMGKMGDGGIDGKIKLGKLGLDLIFIQARNWENSVSRPEIQKFIGALDNKRAKKAFS